MRWCYPSPKFFPEFWQRDENGTSTELKEG